MVGLLEPSPSCVYPVNPNEDMPPGMVSSPPGMPYSGVEIRRAAHGRIHARELVIALRHARDGHQRGSENVGPAEKTVVPVDGFVESVGAESRRR